MKIKNKRTGEIVDLLEGDLRGVRFGEQIVVKPVAALDKEYIYNSLAELCEEWIDYEEPKGYWYIDFDGDVCGEAIPFDEETNQKRKEIGNKFETEEEAEKAIGKLKALTRLNEAGLKIEVENVSDIDSIMDGYVDFDLHCYFERYDGFGEDMDTLFGGKE